MVWCLVGWSGKMTIAQTTTAAMQPYKFLAVFHYFSFYFTCFFVTRNRAKRHLQ